MNIASKIFRTAILVALAACTGKKVENVSASEQVKFEQYLVEGQRLYQLHCANCHQTDGAGLGKLYPPLAGSDYMMDDVLRVSCIIKNGLSSEIKVNGVDYHQPMPAIPQLTELEIAEIITYTANSWGNKSGIVNVKNVNEALKKCDQ